MSLCCICGPQQVKVTSPHHCQGLTFPQPNYPCHLLHLVELLGTVTHFRHVRHKLQRTNSVTQSLADSYLTRPKATYSVDFHLKTHVLHSAKKSFLKSTFIFWEMCWHGESCEPPPPLLQDSVLHHQVSYHPLKQIHP